MKTVNFVKVISTLTFIGIISLSPASANDKKTIFAHMVNTPNAVRWGLSQGANAVEMDLRFDGNTPSKFQHSIGLQPCDCSCVCAVGSSCGDESVCKQLWSETRSHCTASSTAETMTFALGNQEFRNTLAVIYIDSKLDSSIIDLAGAGAKVVQLLNRNVFARGFYRGQVIINGANTIYSDYLRGALQAAVASPYANRYFYTYDFEGDDYNKVWNELLRLGTNNIVYSVGISICSEETFYTATAGSIAKNAYSAIGIWTLDSQASMTEYKNRGVDSIMTNKPSLAVPVFGASNIATPGNALVPRQVPPAPPSTESCDCNYHSGGCTISKAAPPFKACKCTYKGAWTCGGENVACPDRNARLCWYPESTKEACQLGGGDCGGY